MFTPDEEQRAREAARRERISIAEFIRRAVREAAGRALAEPADPWAGLPRKPPGYVTALAEQQGVKPFGSLDDMPAIEFDVDEFIRETYAERDGELEREPAEERGRP